MRRRLITLAALTAVGVMVYRSIPDLKRYMRMRSM
ncbi:DUF6893 family small protein [Sphaerisporangium aureirubrum]|uniref:DUF6893 family small protein n=1 Tax=Sphaerisporangium aureirubrum TaxID=1544736 RepID=A0ABW1NLV7_9ACTN